MYLNDYIIEYILQVWLIVQCRDVSLKAHLHKYTHDVITRASLNNGILKRLIYICTERTNLHTSVVFKMDVSCSAALWLALVRELSSRVAAAALLGASVAIQLAS